MKRKPRLVILNPTCLEVLEVHCARLDSLGVDWHAEPGFCSLQESDVDSVVQGADALILPAAIRDLPRAGQMRQHSSLKVLSIAASGYDWLDVEAATENGIIVTNAPVREGVEVVADMTWALLLAVTRQVPHYHQRICAGNYERGMGVAAWRKTLGIVGLGNIGRAVARRAAGFEMRVLATEPRPDLSFVAQHGINLVPLETLLRESLEKTRELGETVFYSRSRQRLWHKGETSGNNQKVVGIATDCDQDALVIRVHPKGPACHTGARSCFFEEVEGFSTAS